MHPLVLLAIYVAMNSTPKNWASPFQSGQGSFGPNLKPMAHSKWDTLFLGWDECVKPPKLDGQLMEA